MQTGFVSEVSGLNRYTVLVLFVVTMLMLAMSCLADEAAPAVGVSVDIAADGPVRSSDRQDKGGSLC